MAGGGAGRRPGLIAAVNQGKGFQGVVAQMPTPGWGSPLGEIDLAVGIDTHPVVVGSGAEIALITVHGANGSRTVDPATKGAWAPHLQQMLAAATQRVRVNGPPLALSRPLNQGEAVLEATLVSPIAVTLPDGSLSVERIVIPFADLEHGLIFLGAPDYREAIASPPMAAAALKEKVDRRFAPLLNLLAE